MIELEQVHFVYGRNTPFRKEALKGVSLVIPDGQFVGIIGHTGSGKSTLVQHLNGLLRPDEGRVMLDGRDIWAEPKKIRQVRFAVGLVFQYPEHQLFEETVAKDIAFGPGNMGLDTQEVDRRVRLAMDWTGLKEELRDLSPFDLSGGQRRRVAIAGVMAMMPKVLILDEPTAGLDPRGRDRLMSRLHRYHEQTGSTVILVSHSMEDVARNAERIIVMNEGEIALDGGPAQIFCDSDRIMQMGLELPQVTRVVRALRQRGVDIDPSIYTVEQAKEALLACLSKGGAQQC